MAWRSAAVRPLAIVIIEPVSIAAITRSAGIDEEGLSSGRAVGAGVVALRAGPLVQRGAIRCLCVQVKRSSAITEGSDRSNDAMVRQLRAIRLWIDGYVAVFLSAPL